MLGEFSNYINNRFYNSLFHRCEVLRMVHHRLGKGEGDPIDGGEKDFEFAFEMFVEGGPGHARFFGDVTHGGSFEATAFETL